jgi:hypothetical protein
VKETIFETPVEMPPKSNSSDVLKTSQTPGELRSNLSPGTMPVDRNVKNIQRPRRGHGY